MLRPDRLWLVLFAGVLAVAVGGCKSHPKAKLGPSQAPVYSVGDPESVRREVRWRDLLTLATRDMQVGNLDAAERKVREALKLAPEAPDALVLQAGIDDRRGRTRQAGENFRKAAELAPQRGDVLNNYGAWLCQQGQPAESLVWFDRALQAPGYATPGEAQANAGSCALDAGQLERAERDLRAALVAAPANPVALESMAQLSFRQGRYMEARAFAERRIAAAPATRSVLQLASQIEVKLGDRAASDRYLQRIRQEFPQEAGS
ncbi:type IV pilus biogenesis/stability protein PilW [Stenotrophomonas maltophilia]|uniref:type IV pilus biogenesis/stability protein PilW n=1 Tax=Stenotrophomonas maltophilia TaxID=40324 RepID=UPI0019D482D9|nr:type IV pilus biogenesis/stability protein PilW [Stenotrophomonas maltophilia]MBN7829738.1 type IV pilus biogenesis/stability protein PilW [Stenotrophomonas maltophilia]MBN7833825.1 type IV pilus biogenesis/stability protein PilW [Stenotrophomonas maltophilia]MBN7857753.1 type IV pilus biogenesis/stability protein PilW [Stenotrophomonas maltophilia]MBN7917006.1 type IV pilus biogenesis/stability protein PilW [Stenotrophomonas maltophilia]MBO2845106.1 type IV pilus biogenesis/stability prote